MKLWRVRPGRLLLKGMMVATGVAAAIALAALLWPQPFESVAYYAGVLLAALGLTALLDLWASRRPPALQIERILPGSLALGQWTGVRLRLQHDLSHVSTVSVYDHHPDFCQVMNLPLENLELRAGQYTEATYRLRPLQRGLAVFPQLELKTDSVLGLWELQFFVPLRNEVKVYPNFSAVAGYSLLATDSHVSLLGIKRQQRRGEGTDFHQLREYRSNDAVRQIDWKATSRRLQLISREYQDERDQQVVLMLDSGRRMRAHDTELSHFDHALNASLMLAYVALRQGDAVGMMSFGQGTRWIPAVKGGTNIHVLLNGFYDLEAGPCASDFLAAGQELMTRQTKRSLIVLLTNLRDEDSDDLLQTIKLMRRRHLVLVANLQEEALIDAEQQSVETFEEALRYGGVLQFQQLRRKMQERLQAEGVLVLDCMPRELSVRLINRYLEVKRANAL